ncbi:MAG: glycosyltransferase family 4 protein, partial [Acidobacteria bacterium]|nr:glycosyltransferase family 4 protein [Acidobacteriota bacterium]
RDYWPLCYWSDLLLDPERGDICPACTPGRMTRCVRPRGGALWPLAVPLVPYMRASLRRKQDALARADAVVAISSAIARDLLARAPALQRDPRDRARGMSGDAVTIIPNPVDVRAVQAEAAEEPAPLDRPYVLYAGKLETNKGVSKLLAAIAAAGDDVTLVVAGDGTERPRLEAAARAARRDVRFLGWQPRAAVLGWMRHAALLVFPSHWPEPFGRVLVEAGAVGCPVAALETGGVGDIVIHDQTGLLAHDDDELGRHVARLWNDAALRARLAAAARRRVERTFDTPVVVAQVEALYERLLQVA